jgi:hypothetical protein
MALSNVDLRRSSTSSLGTDSDYVFGRRGSAQLAGSPKLSPWYPNGSDLPPRSPSVTLDVPSRDQQVPRGSSPQALSRSNSNGPTPRTPLDTTGPLAVDWSVFMSHETMAPSFDGVPKAPPSQSFEVHEVKRYSIDLEEIPRRPSSGMASVPGSRSPRAGLTPITVPDSAFLPRTSSVTLEVPTARSSSNTPRSSTSRPTTPSQRFNPSPTVDLSGPTEVDWSVFLQNTSVAPSFDAVPKVPAKTTEEIHEVRTYSYDLGPLPLSRSSSMHSLTPRSSRVEPFAAPANPPPRRSSLTPEVPRAPVNPSSTVSGRRSSTPSGSAIRGQFPSPTGLVDRSGATPVDWSVFTEHESAPPSFDASSKAPPTKTFETREVRTFSHELGPQPRSRSSSLTFQPIQPQESLYARSPRFEPFAAPANPPPRRSSLMAGVPLPLGSQSPTVAVRRSSTPHVRALSFTDPKSPIDLSGPTAVDWSVFAQQETLPPSFDGTPRAPPTTSYETHETRTYSVDLGPAPRSRSSSISSQPLLPRDDQSRWSPTTVPAAMTGTGLPPRSFSPTYAGDTSLPPRSFSATYAGDAGLPPRKFSGNYAGNAGSGLPPRTRSLSGTVSDRSPFHTPRSSASDPLATPLDPNDRHPADWSVFLQQATSAPTFDGTHKAPPTQTSEVREVRTFSVAL